MRKAFLAAACAAVMWATAGEAQAAPISFSWTDTVSGSSLPSGVSVGDSFTFTLVVDNGGATTVSQTWTSDDFVSASISLNGGAYIGTATANFGTGGAFQTDGGSAIIAVPTEWYAVGGSGSDSLGATDFDWFINGFNGIWSGGETNIWATNVSGNQDPANWSIGDAPSEVPEPSTWLLFGAGLAMAAIRRRNHIRS